MARTNSNHLKVIHGLQRHVREQHARDRERDSDGMVSTPSVWNVHLKAGSQLFSSRDGGTWAPVALPLGSGPFACALGSVAQGESSTVEAGEQPTLSSS